MAKLKTILPFAEVLVGLSAVSFSLYQIWDVSNCKPGAEFCASLGMMPVVLLLIPGCLMLLAGFMCLLTTRFPIWTIQATLIASLVLYYGFLIASISVLSE